MARLEKKSDKPLQRGGKPIKRAELKKGPGKADLLANRKGKK